MFICVKVVEKKTNILAIRHIHLKTYTHKHLLDIVLRDVPMKLSNYE